VLRYGALQELVQGLNKSLAYPTSDQYVSADAKFSLGFYVL